MATRILVFGNQASNSSTPTSRLLTSSPSSYLRSVSSFSKIDTTSTEPTPVSSVVVAYKLRTAYITWVSSQTIRGDQVGRDTTGGRAGQRMDDRSRGLTVLDICTSKAAWGRAAKEARHLYHSKRTHGWHRGMADLATRIRIPWSRLSRCPLWDRGLTSSTSPLEVTGAKVVEVTRYISQRVCDASLASS